MKILVLNSILYTPNGYVHRVKSIKDTMIYNMCLGFKENGHDVTLAAAKEYEPTEDHSYGFDVLFFKSFLRLLFKPTVLPFSMTLFVYIWNNRKKYDLIISSEVFSFPSLFASIICPEKTVIWHELALHPSLLFKIPSLFWYKIICRLFIKKVFIIPRSIPARTFISKYCTNVSSICVEHGINIEKFRYSNNKENYFTYVGQLISRKNVDYLIKVFWEYVNKIDKNIKLMICGDGPLRNNLEKLVNSYNLTDNVIFLGKLPHYELNSVIMKSLGCLISTKQDNNMVSIPESIVSGTPIITNSIPTNSYIVFEENLGIVKDDWGIKELDILVKENHKYATNCIKYRERLSSRYAARTIVELYSNYIKEYNH